MTVPQGNKQTNTDVVLIGAGVMSATLGALLRRLQPDWSIEILERLNGPSQESSDAWNNAGTGHSALCELNYTPKTADGGVDITKAVGVNEKFQVSRQFWSFGVENNLLGDPSEWINPVAHMSFVRGEEGQKYLRKRFELLSKHPLFETLEHTEDIDEVSKLVPLVGKDRNPDEKVALSHIKGGTDVNFGALTRQLLGYLARTGTDVRYQAEVKDLERSTDGSWKVRYINRALDEEHTINAKFVFVGAGGGALHLLQKSGIPEIRGIGGFPVGGQWLRCTNEELIEQHNAKVYGQAAVGAPPMSVPHLDTRVIDGKRALLFGPFAGWTPKFLKRGRFTDLPLSVRPNNFLSMAGVGVTELGLVKYLVTELAKTHEKRVETLREFMPSAESGDWEKVIAGQRVQVIKPNKKTGGTLEFGTAVVNSSDGSIAGLLGASPGASTAVDAMLDVLNRCFPDRMATWDSAIKEMVPSYGRKLSEDVTLYNEQFERSQKALKLES